MLKLVLPKGSLEKSTLELFEGADLGIVRSSSVDYRATIDDPRIDEVRILRPQEIPTYVADGLFDLGITGRDWISETESDVDVAPLAAVAGVRDLVQEESAFHLRVEEIHQVLPALLAELDRQQAELSQLTTHHATLEDVFMALTGRHLRDE